MSYENSMVNDIGKKSSLFGIFVLSGEGNIFWRSNNFHVRKCGWLAYSTVNEIVKKRRYDYSEWNKTSTELRFLSRP
jgi:hypothetical protein